MSSWLVFFKTQFLVKVVLCIVQLASVSCLSVFNLLWCKECMVVYNAGFMWKLNKQLLQVQGMFLVMFWNQCLLLNHFSRCECYASKEQQRKRILFWSANIYGISLRFVCTESMKFVNRYVMETDLSSCLVCWRQSLIPGQSLCVLRYLCRRMYRKCEREGEPRQCSKNIAHLLVTSVFRAFNKCFSVFYFVLVHRIAWTNLFADSYHFCVRPVKISTYS